MPGLTQVPIISSWWDRHIHHCPRLCFQGLKESTRAGWDTAGSTAGNTLSGLTSLVWKRDRNSLQTFDFNHPYDCWPAATLYAHYGPLSRAPLSPLEQITESYQLMWGTQGNILTQWRSVFLSTVTDKRRMKPFSWLGRSRNKRCMYRDMGAAIKLPRPELFPLLSDFIWII